MKSPHLKGLSEFQPKWYYAKGDLEARAFERELNDLLRRSTGGGADKISCITDVWIHQENDDSNFQVQIHRFLCVCLLFSDSVCEQYKSGSLHMSIRRGTRSNESDFQLSALRAHLLL